MAEKKTAPDELNGLINDLQVFIELSIHGRDEASLREWIDETINRVESRCWELKNCSETNCPAYKNECGRCWLIAGTMCGGEIQGRFAAKYDSCTSCEVYRLVIGDDQVSRLREQVITLIHSLRMRQQELIETRSELKILSGLLPICMNCKKIRDGQGAWTQIESYIHRNSEARFSHGICPECLEELHPGIMDRNYGNNNRLKE
ncbi:MAG: hypothetical protein KJ950_06890 [Proteobacteria bacterium]|nr:hypothetical protein [Pseudomonadota bacterium]MBU1686767.1 hypothetical protein [Pseudomonadota bacterium]